MRQIRHQKKYILRSRLSNRGVGAERALMPRVAESTGRRRGARENGENMTELELDEIAYQFIEKHYGKEFTHGNFGEILRCHLYHVLVLPTMPGVDRDWANAVMKRSLMLGETTGKEKTE